MTALLDEIDAVIELETYDGNAGMVELLSKCRGEIERLQRGNALARSKSAVIALNEESPDDEFAEAISLIDGIAQEVAEQKRLWKAITLERCERRGDLLIGARRFYAGLETKKKCRDPRLALNIMLETAGGDLGAVADCLAADAWKAGASEKLLGSRFLEAFEVTRGPVLKDGELLKSQKQLLETNDAFTR